MSKNILKLLSISFCISFVIQILAILLLSTSLVPSSGKDASIAFSGISVLNTFFHEPVFAFKVMWPLFLPVFVSSFVTAFIIDANFKTKKESTR